EGQYQRAINILNENRDKLDALAEKLLEKEVIFREDLEAIFGKRAWDPELTETPVSSTEDIKKDDKPVVIDNDEERQGLNQ
ncbi:peptidase M41, partial [Riemerella anatipestifer]|nr:peptidase M41 [Riemerella anatipestifer]